MPIQITCQKCHKRFSVSEKFAGKSGPCPNCKATIKIPEKSEEVVIHAPENLGPTDSSGKAILKPIEREEVQTNPVAVVGIVGGIIVAIVAAIALRMLYPQTAEATSVEDPTLWWILAAGAVLLAPPLVWGGYWFLRNDELEPHKGTELLVRVLVCGAIYAALWGAYALVKTRFFPNARPEMFAFAYLGPIFLGAGGTAAMACLEIDFGNGAIHYAFYLLVTVLFCFIIGVPAY